MPQAERHVRLFRNGRNQALRIPREFELEGNEAIRIGYEEENLYTYIFFHKGTLYECYTDAEPSLLLSTPIAKVSALDFEQSNKRITMSIEYEYHGEVLRLDQVMALRAGGE